MGLRDLFGIFEFNNGLSPNSISLGTKEASTLRLRLETLIPTGILTFSPGGKIKGVQSTDRFNRAFGTPRNRVFTTRPASFPWGNTPHLDRSGSNPPSPIPSLELFAARKRLWTAATTASSMNARSSSPTPPLPPPQLLLPHSPSNAFPSHKCNSPKMMHSQRPCAQQVFQNKQVSPLFNHFSQKLARNKADTPQAKLFPLTSATLPK
jgi:hypothetical protein